MFQLTFIILPSFSKGKPSGSSAQVLWCNIPLNLLQLFTLTCFKKQQQPKTYTQKLLFKVALIKYGYTYLLGILVLVIHVLLKQFLKYLWLSLMDALAHSEYWELQMHEAIQVTSGLFIQLTNFHQKTFFITTVISAVAAFPGIRDQTPVRRRQSLAAASP